GAVGRERRVLPTENGLGVLTRFDLAALRFGQGDASVLQQPKKHLDATLRTSLRLAFSPPLRNELFSDGHDHLLCPSAERTAERCPDVSHPGSAVGPK